jgi:hypothetical protein
MSRATRAFIEAVSTGDQTHAGDDRVAAHIGAAHKRTLTHIRDEDGRPVWVPTKERPDSPFPINAAIASIIGWQARTDAIKSGALATREWRVA